MTSTAVVIRREIRANLRSWLTMSMGFFMGFQAFQLALLVARFGTLPNYVTVYPWSANIARIVRMTPSIADMVPIMLDEYLIEIGSMNHAFGHGIAEWSFVFVPAKAAVVLTVAALLAANVVLLRASGTACSRFGRFGASVTASSGAAVAGAAAVTMTWVVCCVAPSWVVGLSVMGVGVTTALALAPLGGWLSLVGLLALGGTAIWLARRLVRRSGCDAVCPMPLSIRMAGVPS